MRINVAQRRMKYDPRVHRKKHDAHRLPGSKTVARNIALRLAHTGRNFRPMTVTDAVQGDCPCCGNVRIVWIAALQSQSFLWIKKSTRSGACRYWSIQVDLGRFGSSPATTKRGLNHSQRHVDVAALCIEMTAYDMGFLHQSFNVRASHPG